jgi:rubrerythrin
MGLQGTDTERNLVRAFAGESQARNRYDFFAKQAKKEGYIQISKFFAETAEQEKSHAKQLWRCFAGGKVEATSTFSSEGAKSTLENLKAALADENDEHRRMYPAFSETAQAEGFKKIAALFKLLAQAEQYHARRFSRLVKQIESNTVYQRQQSVRWVCVKCGYVHEGTDAPRLCPLCQHGQGYFEVRH